VTSTLTEAAEPAAQKVSRKQAATLATFGRGKVAISDPEHRRLIDEARATYAAAGAAMNRLAVFEDELARFTGRLRGPDPIRWTVGVLSFPTDSDRCGPCGPCETSKPLWAR
jgi:hypothetical protein